MGSQRAGLDWVADSTQHQSVQQGFPQGNRGKRVNSALWLYDLLGVHSSSGHESNSGSWRWAGRPGMLQSLESQRVGHDWATGLDWMWLEQIANEKTRKKMESEMSLERWAAAKGDRALETMPKDYSILRVRSSHGKVLCRMMIQESLLCFWCVSEAIR